MEDRTHIGIFSTVNGYEANFPLHVLDVEKCSDEKQTVYRLLARCGGKESAVRLLLKDLMAFTRLQECFARDAGVMLSRVIENEEFPNGLRTWEVTVAGLLAHVESKGVCE